MKEVILTLLAQAQALIEDTIGEVRERCCDPTHAKFVALHAAIGDAIREGALATPVDAVPVAAAAPDLVAQLTEMMGGTDPVTLMRGLAEQISIDLGERVALIVHAALEESEAKTA